MNRDLKDLIEEEVKAMLKELALCHSPKTGHFTTCSDKGAIYSLTKKGARAGNVDDRYVARGKVKSKERGQPPKLSKVPYGANTSRELAAGRKLIDGTDIPAKFSLSKYPKRYGQLREDFPELEEIDLTSKVQLGELLSLIFDSLSDTRVDEATTGVDGACRRAGYVTMKDAQVSILNSINAFAKAEKGELNKVQQGE